MSKLSKEQVEKLTVGLNSMIRSVNKSHFESFNMIRVDQCVIGKISNPEGNKDGFTNALKRLFNFNAEFTPEALAESNLSNLQKMVNNLFIASFPEYVVTKQEWLNAAKKVYKHLEKKLHDRPKK